MYLRCHPYLVLCRVRVIPALYVGLVIWEYCREDRRHQKTLKKSKDTFAESAEDENDLAKTLRAWHEMAVEEACKEVRTEGRGRSA